MSDYNPISDLDIFSQNAEKDEDQKLLSPVLYLSKFPKSRTFREIIESFDRWFEVPPETFQIIKEIFTLTYCGNTMIDDIHANSAVRCCRPTARVIYGVPFTLNTGYYACMIAQEKCRSLNNQQAMDIIAHEVLEMQRGQGMDLYFKENNKCPTEEEYFKISTRKPVVPLRLAVKLMQLFGKNTPDFSRLCELSMVYYRLRNEYMNLWANEHGGLKNMEFSDITEGNFTFPIIRAIQNSPHSDDIIRILQQRSTEVGVKSYCVKLMERTDCKNYTLAKINEIHGDILGEIQKIGGSRDLRALVKRISPDPPQP